MTIFSLSQKNKILLKRGVYEIYFPSDLTVRDMILYPLGFLESGRTLFQVSLTDKFRKQLGVINR